ncbi:MAG: hypothetical protein ACK6D2_16200, partial [Planctomycetota bacterium]
MKRSSPPALAATIAITRGAETARASITTIHFASGPLPPVLAARQPARSPSKPCAPGVGPPAGPVAQAASMTANAAASTADDGDEWADFGSIGRSLLLPHRLAREAIKTPFQTVRADFPHTAYRWSLGFTALCDLRVL